MSNATPKYALLIDGDNAQPELIPLILKAVEKHGKPIIKRVYGDFSRDALKNWEVIAREHGLKVDQNYHNSNGKNATDIVLVIDAMDLLHDKKDKLDGFCIVSSDSDFTHLIKRMKEDGLHTIGVGKEDSLYLKAVVDDFIAIEGLQGPQLKSSTTASVASTIPQTGQHFLQLFLDAYKVCLNKGLQDINGRVQLVEIRDVMIELNPEFKNSSLQNLRLLAEKAKALSQQNPQRIKVDEHHDTTPVTHHIQVVQSNTNTSTASNGTNIQPKSPAASNGASTQSKAPASKSTPQQTDLNKLISAYTHAIGKLDQGDKDGWLRLSPLGSVLRQLYPQDDHYTYNGTKYANLGKYIEKMRTDFPQLIEFKSPSPANGHGQIRIKRSTK